MPVGEYRMIDDLQDDHPVKPFKSFCYQDDRAPDGGGGRGTLGGGFLYNALQGETYPKPIQHHPKPRPHIDPTQWKSFEIHANHACSFRKLIRRGRCCAQAMAARAQEGPGAGVTSIGEDTMIDDLQDDHFVRPVKSSC